MEEVQLTVEDFKIQLGSMLVQIMALQKTIELLQSQIPKVESNEPTESVSDTEAI